MTLLTRIGVIYSLGHVQKPGTQERYLPETPVTASKCIRDQLEGV